MSRRAVLAGGLAGTSAAVSLALTGSTVAGAAASRGAAQELVDARLDLLIDPNQTRLVAGTVDGLPVDANGSLFGGPHGGPATVIGSIAKLSLEAIMTTQDQAPHGSGYVTRSRLTASVGDDALVLSGTFNLDQNFEFDKGTVAGSDRGRKVACTVEPHSSSGNGATIRGDFAGNAVVIAATVPDGPGQTGSVIGSVAKRRVELYISPTGQTGAFSSTRVTGIYNGPTEILAIIIGAIAFFAA